MKILFVSHAVPDPNGRGIERRAAQHLHTLRQIGEITLVIPDALAATSEQRCDALSKLDLARIVRRPDLTRDATTRARHAKATNRLTRAWAALRRRPEIDQAVPSRYRAECRQLVEGDFDLIFAFRLASAIWLESILPAKAQIGTPRIVDFDDIESIAMARSHALLKASIFWRLMLWRWTEFARHMEQHLCRWWTKVLVCSEHDVTVLKQRNQAEAAAIPNAVAFDSPRPEPASGPFRLLFVGTFSYGPNVAGILWFADEIWPALRETLGHEIEFYAVGFDPPPEVLALGGRPGITIVGPVESLPPHYAAAHAVIAPIFSGGGTRIKIIEAMAFGKPIVTTQMGCEGLQVEHGAQLLIADDAPAFQSAVMKLARDASYRSSLGHAGWDYGQRHFSPEIADARLKNILSNTRLD